MVRTIKISCNEDLSLCAILDCILSICRMWICRCPNGQWIYHHRFNLETVLLESNSKKKMISFCRLFNCQSPFFIFPLPVVLNPWHNQQMIFHSFSFVNAVRCTTLFTRNNKGKCHYSAFECVQIYIGSLIWHHCIALHCIAMLFEYEAKIDNSKYRNI